eukprot:2012683-Pyramimonas_sp.AAC.1
MTQGPLFLGVRGRSVHSIWRRPKSLPPRPSWSEPRPPLWPPGATQHPQRCAQAQRPRISEGSRH